MIPDFDEDGLLPSGIHPAALYEIANRFGIQTDRRREQMESIFWFMKLVRQDDVRRMILNGSFVTAEPDPGDVDIVLLIGSRFGQCGLNESDWDEALPYLHVELATDEGFSEYVNDFFAIGRDRRKKGMIEVIL